MVMMLISLLLALEFEQLVVIDGLGVSLVHLFVVDTAVGGVVEEGLFFVDSMQIKSRTESIGADAGVSLGDIDVVVAGAAAGSDVECSLVVYSAA